MIDERETDTVELPALSAVDVPESSDPSALEDVPLTVEVEIGYADVPLEQVRKFGRGTRLALAAAAGDPVTLILNGLPVALGDLVVVGDHYAVRITRLLTGSDRGGV